MSYDRYQAIDKEALLACALPQFQKEFASFSDVHQEVILYQMKLVQQKPHRGEIQRNDKENYHAGIVKFSYYQETFRLIYLVDKKNNQFYKFFSIKMIE